MTPIVSMLAMMLVCFGTIMVREGGERTTGVVLYVLALPVLAAYWVLRRRRDRPDHGPRSTLLLLVAIPLVALTIGALAPLG